MLGLHCCTEALPSCSKLRLLFIAVLGLLIAVVSLVEECGLLEYRVGSWGTQALVATRDVESPQTRNRTCVPCVGKQISIHCTTREVPISDF